MKKVLVICGGKSSEHDVSLNSAKTIIQNIDKDKYIVDMVIITKEGTWTCKNEVIDNLIEFIKRFDVVIPIMHGLYGEDGTLQGMLDLFDIKYVGSKCGASYLCMDKQRTKEILYLNGINIVPYQIYNKNDKIVIPFPIIVKPANGGSSIGINVAHNKKELKIALKEALKYDKKVLLETFLTDARELECAILKDNNKLIVSDVGEVKHSSEFYDFNEKYNKGVNTILSSDIDKKIKNSIKKYAKEAFIKLELDNLARIDFLYSNGKIYLNEINTIPGFTETSMYKNLIENLGINTKDLITKLIENAK